MESIIIGVDTGNRCIKTKTTAFVAGVRSSLTPPVANRSVIQYGGKYWALTTERINYLRDKTETDDYFVLTLFAVMKELEARGCVVRKEAPVPVRLGVGLPPAHIAALKERFIKYFSRGTVTFRYNNMPVSIRIEEVCLFAQGYAAIFTLPKEIRKSPHAYIVDIGGYTTDVMALEHGALDPKMCVSLDFGIIGLYSLVQTEIHSATGHMPSEDMIDELLAGNGNIRMSTEMKNIATEIAMDYTTKLFRKLSEMGVDLTLSQAICVGGGSARLRPYIEQCPLVSAPYIFEDIHANAAGYEAFILASDRRKGA